MKTNSPQPWLHKVRRQSETSLPGLKLLIPKHPIHYSFTLFIFRCVPGSVWNKRPDPVFSSSAGSLTSSAESLQPGFLSLEEEMSLRDFSVLSRFWSARDRGLSQCWTFSVCFYRFIRVTLPKGIAIANVSFLLFGTFVCSVSLTIFTTGLKIF